MHIQLVAETTAIELALLAIAFGLSAVVGFERQRMQKSAGLRTHTLVGLGSAVFTLVSAYGFATTSAPEAMLDPSRIAAQIVSGIGFLGAGVIFVRKNAVSGLTTAASIWVTAAIGMACGAGMPVLAAATTLFYLLAMGLFTVVGRRMHRSEVDDLFAVEYLDGRGVLRDILTLTLRLGYEASLTAARRLEREDEERTVEAVMRFTRRRGGSNGELIEVLSAVDGVVEVEIMEDDT